MRRPALLGVAMVGLFGMSTVVQSLALFSDTSAPSGDFTAGSLHAPTGVSAVGGATIVLTWTPTIDAGATGYILERATALAGPYGQIATITPATTATYADSPSTGTYWYRLSTYLSNWTSATTAPVSATVTAGVSTGPKPCLPADNASDTGGNGDGYQTTPGNACASDGLLAQDGGSGTAGRSTVCSNPSNDRHRWWGYAFGLPGSVTSINGITVRADAGMSNSSGTSVLCVELSWDGGTSWTAARSVTLTSNGITTYTLGSASDTWGRTWSASDFSTANFRVRITDATSTSKTYRLDYLAVTIQYSP